MDALARSLERAAHLPDGEVAAAYEETEAGCSRRLANKNAVMILPPFPSTSRTSRSSPRAASLRRATGGRALQRWTLVTERTTPLPSRLHGLLQRGRFKRFVRAGAKLPAQVDVQPAPPSSPRCGGREQREGAVLLDGAQLASMARCPSRLARRVETSQPCRALVATVGKRIDERRWKGLETAFLRLTEDRSARNALDGVRMAASSPWMKNPWPRRARWRRAR